MASESDMVLPWMHGAAGILGGAISTATFYPLEFIRTRMHTYKGGAEHPLRSAREIIRQEGIKGMYRGLTISVVSHSLAWGMYLTSFRTAQQCIFTATESVSNDSNDSLKKSYRNALNDFLSACFAAALTGTLITPLNLIKTRRQLYDVHKSPKPHSFVYGFQRIVEKEGLRALLRGVGPQIFLTGNTTIQVTFYEGIKREFFHDRENPTAVEISVASAIAKAIASVIFNPLEVVRTRLQDKRNRSLPEYRTMGTALRTIWRTEGFYGLYRGLPVNICRVVPTTVTAFVLYEKCLSTLVAINSFADSLLPHRKSETAPELG